MLAPFKKCTTKPTNSVCLKEENDKLVFTIQYKQFTEDMHYKANISLMSLNSGNKN